MWHDNALSAYLVLALGNWLGGVTKGVTGFGSAILNLCCWIAFVVAGVESGSLQQAVVTEALSSTLIAPGLLYVTRAHATADFRMVAAISLFVGLSSPVGAAALARWNAKLIELAMAAALLVIILAEQLSKLARWWQRSAAYSCRAAAQAKGSTLQGLNAEDQQQKQTQQQKLQWDSAQMGVTAADEVDVEAAAGSSSSSDSSGSSSSNSGSCVGSAAAACPAVNAGDCTVCVVDAESVEAGATAGVSQRTLSSDGEGYGSHTAALFGTSLRAAAPAGPTAEQPNHDNLLQPLLADTVGAEAIESSSEDDSGTFQRLHSVHPTGSGCMGGGGVRGGLAMLAIGAVAGTASGIMEGLTGMNGPPIIICYRLRNTPKATVRGNNAILNLLQMRLIPYYFMGLIVLKDLQLYLVTCAAGVFGAFVGDLLSYHMQQKAFQDVLGVLMVLCCFLMFASGLGYV